MLNGTMVVRTLSLSKNRQALAVYVPEPPDGLALVKILNLPLPRAVLLLHGGASDMLPTSIVRVRCLVEEMARMIAEKDITVIDGGTQAGIMEMIGEAHASANALSPLIGVCPAALVCWPNEPTNPDRVPLEPNHTHFVLTPGAKWGDETETMFALASALASDVPSLAVLVNGGKVAKQEVLYNIRQNREIIVIQGSGRLADEIAAVVSGRSIAQDKEMAFILEKGGITLIDVHDDPKKLVSCIRKKLFHEDSENESD